MTVVAAWKACHVGALLSWSELVAAGMQKCLQNHSHPECQSSMLQAACVPCMAPGSLYAAVALCCCVAFLPHFSMRSCWQMLPQSE